SNTGHTPYTAATLTDDLTGILNVATYNNVATPTTGILTHTGNTLTWTGTLTHTGNTLTWTGNLTPGATATITYSATVNNPDTGGKILTDTITSTTPGNNCPTDNGNPSCTTTTTILTPQLTLIKSSDVRDVLQGGTVHYTVAVSNTGQIPYTGATFSDDLTGILDDATYNNDATATTGTATYNNNTLTWTGNLPVAATATITYSITVNNPDTGNKTLADTLSSTTSGNNCPAGGTDTRCSTSVNVDISTTLTITKTADAGSAAPGAAVHYTTTVTNSGGTTIVAATFSDALNGVLDDAAYNSDATASAGAVVYLAPTLTCTGTLNPGATATITYSLTVNHPDTGNLVLSDSAVSATPGNNCPTGSPDPRCVSTVTVAQLLINNTSTSTSTTPGGEVRFTLTATNTGQTPYQGITLTTTAADIFDDAVPNGDQTATLGTLTVTPTGVTWNGTIPIGATLTITGTVTVKNPDTGNKQLTSTVTTTAPGTNCPTNTTDPRCTVNLPVLTPALTITKTTDTTTATPGTTVH